MEGYLWGLLLLMCYNKTSVNCSLASGVDEDTFCKWSWWFVYQISFLEEKVVSGDRGRTDGSVGSVVSLLLSPRLVVSLLSLFAIAALQIIWENRKRGDEGNDCLASVDGTDFRFGATAKEMWSFKFKKGGIRYQVLLCIKTGEIVLVDGPFPPGLINDLSSIRFYILEMLEEGERMEADDGYLGEAPKYIKCPKSFTNDKAKLAMQQRVRSRHETVNKRFKQWGCMRQRFRHSVRHHSAAFRAVAVLTQLAIEFGEPLFEVDYSDDPPDDTDD